MQDIHDPSPEFTQYLEWQTRTELRREKRFSRPSPSMPRLTRVARIAALVLFSLFSGAGVVIAAERIQESRELEIMLDRNRVVLELAERRIATAGEVQERERLLFESGFIPQSEMTATSVWIGELERDRDHLRLDRVEMETARRKVDGRLSAPLVGPRDFVSEHLRIDKNHLARIVEARASQEATVRAGYESGRETTAVLLDAQFAARAALDEVARIDARLALRADFLVGRLGALECENRDLIGDAEFRRAGYQRQAEQLDTQLEHARRVEAQGFGAGDVTRLQSERDIVGVELKLIDLELELLR